jgi:hypothetical protein
MRSSVYHYSYDGVKMVDDRVQEVIDGFVHYLEENYDPQGIKSVITLMYD